MSIKNTSKMTNKNSIARKLIVAIILFSSFITLIITTFQLYSDYKRDVRGIHEEIEMIRKNHLESISHSIWIFDPTATQIILESLVKHQDIEYLRIYVDDKTSWQTGEPISKRNITAQIPLQYSSAGEIKKIGELTIVASLDSIYKRLTDKCIFILLTNFLKTFLVALFSLGVFQYLVTRHLVKLGQYAKQVSPGSVMPPFSFARKNNQPSQPDELDFVASALNTMQSSLSNEIIKLRKAEEQTKKSTALLEDIMKGANDAIFLKDIKGRYLMANEATCQAMSKEKKDIIGKDDKDLFPESSAQIISENDRIVFQHGEICEAEERLETADGDTIWHTKKTPYRDQDGNIIGLIGISRNITNIKNIEKEKKELEARLNQAQKMEAIGTLAGGIAHDFNNILATILGYAEIAKEDTPPGSSLEKDLDKILLSANRAKDLVKQILAFSRQAQVQLFPINIHLLIKEGLKMLRSSIPTTININEDIDSNIGMVMADPTQIHQILMNLCTNAYHAMEDTGGELSVSLKNTEIGPDQQKILNIDPGKYVEFIVSDTGLGISPDLIDKIFDPYFTTKEIGKGTGMGLAIIHGILQEYRGTITVESQLGKGSTFHVYFPVAESDPLPVAKETEEIPRGTERILFVDDEELLAEMGKDMLERLGYHVTTRRSSIEALTTFQNTPNEFDIVITDQTMPDMTGSDLSRRILQIRPGMPIILCTGYSNRIDKHSAHALGIKEFAFKPLTKGVIAKLIRKALDAEKVLG